MGARMLDELEDYQFVAACDLIPERAEEAASVLGEGVTAYTDFAEMLESEKPDVVYIATNTQPRARLTIAAAEAKVPGIIAEKPMAMSMGEAKTMVEATDKHGSKLIVTHQRRMGSDLLELKDRIDEGAIGDIRLIRTENAGDMLSDGTHAIDSMRWLAGGVAAKWVLGQIFRVLPGLVGQPLSDEFKNHDGFRFGHPVESGALGVIEFENGVRGEIYTGRARQKSRAYQDYEIFGTQGRLWRPGDKGAPPRLWAEGMTGWEDVTIRPENERPNAMTAAWIAFARYLREGGEHPLSGAEALRDHELVMAIYESARLNRRLDLPLEQNAFPLQLMIDEGRA